MKALAQNRKAEVPIENAIAVAAHAWNPKRTVDELTEGLPHLHEPQGKDPEERRNLVSINS